jgi:hypothetical protein
MKDVIDLLKTFFGERTVAWLVLLGLTIPVVWVVYTFFVSGLQNSNQRYYDLKLELYKEITIAAATIATSMDETKIRNAAFNFDELYWGRLVLVEDTAVEAAMVKFRGLIANRETGELETEKLAKREINRNALRSGSLVVALACFNSLQPSWLDSILASFRTPRKGTVN